MKIKFFGGWADGKVMNLPSPPPLKYYVPVPIKISYAAPMPVCGYPRSPDIHVYEFVYGRGYFIRDVIFS